MLDRYFGLSEHATDARTQAIAGITTFLTMVYILFVNPLILADAGMDHGAVFVATCLASALGTLIGAYSIAPGIGFGFVGYVAVKALAGRSSDLRVATVVIALLFVPKFAIA